jgi:pimeloyl-ACP methyl ester carboxylesterase
MGNIQLAALFKESNRGQVERHTLAIGRVHSMAERALSLERHEGWRYHSAGDGPLVLVVLPGSLSGSKGTASMISQILPGTRIVVPEYSPVQKVSEMLDALDAILEQEQISHFSLYGSSFGGLIAQAWARRHQTRISHLILAGAATPNPKRIASHLRSLHILKFVPLWMIHAALSISLLAMLSKKEKGMKWKIEYKQLIARLTKMDLASRYQIAIDLDENYRYSANDLPDSVQILILEGKRDHQSQLHTLYPHAVTHVFSIGGHSMMITQTAEWVEVISKFLGFR